MFSFLCIILRPQCLLAHREPICLAKSKIIVFNRNIFVALVSETGRNRLNIAKVTKHSSHGAYTHS